MSDSIEIEAEGGPVVTHKIPGEQGVHYGGTAASFEDRLWYVHQHDRSKFKVPMAYLVKLSSPLADNPTSSALWSSDKKIDSGELKDEIRTDSRPVAVSTDLRMFLFWSNTDDDKKLYATRRTASDIGTEGHYWGREKKLLDQSGESMRKVSSHDGPFHVIAVTPTALLLTLVRNDALHYHYFFDEDHDLDSTTWRARASSNVSASFIRSMLKISDSNFVLEPYTSLALFSQGAPAENEDAFENTHQTYIVQNVCYSSSSRGWTSAALTAPLDQPPQLPRLDSTVATILPFPRAALRVFMLRDPGSRVVGYFRDRSSGSQTNLLKVMTRSTNGPNGAGKWTPPALLGGASIKTVLPPCAAFVLGIPQGGTTTNADGDEVDHVTRDVREYVFYATDDRGDHNYTERFAYRHYGHLEQVFAAEVANATEASRGPDHETGLYFVQGFFDGPPPVPQANVDANPTAALKGEAHYGETDSSKREESLREEAKFGVKCSLDGAPAIGSGPAFEMSMSNSIGSAFSESQELTSSIDAWVKLRAPVEGGIPQIKPTGSLLARAIILTIDKYHFYDARGIRVEDAPEYSVTKATWSAAISRPFTTLTCTPGDLESYRPAAWNLRMAKVYEKLYGVTVDDYIQEIVEPNALRIKVGGDEVKALSNTWHVSGGVSQTVALTLSEYNESSYRFESSTWLGYKSKGGGVEFSLLGGTEYTNSTTQSTVESQSFTIKSEVDVPEPGDEAGVRVYDYKLYFLPPPKEGPYRWTDELIYSIDNDESGFNQPLRGSVDPGSNCWKVMFVVTYIEYNARVSRLVDFGLAPERVAELEREGIHSTARLIARLGIAPDADLSRIGPAADPQEEQLRAALRKWNRSTM